MQSNGGAICGVVIARNPDRGCERGRSPGQLVCLPHWRKLPRALRTEVWRTFREQPGSREHYDAMRAAFRFLNAPETKEAAP